jgi:uncharacterized C2H2 Zn-finger protein
LEVIFEDDEEIRVHCPRCAAVYTVSRELLAQQWQEINERENS